MVEGLLKTVMMRVSVLPPEPSRSRPPQSANFATSSLLTPREKISQAKEERKIKPTCAADEVVCRAITRAVGLATSSASHRAAHLRETTYRGHRIPPRVSHSEMVCSKLGMSASLKLDPALKTRVIDGVDLNNTTSQLSAPTSYPTTSKTNPVSNQAEIEVC